MKYSKFFRTVFFRNKLLFWSVIVLLCLFTFAFFILLCLKQPIDPENPARLPPAAYFTAVLFSGIFFLLVRKTRANKK